MTRFRDVPEAERAERERQYIEERIKRLNEYAAEHGWVISYHITPKPNFDARDFILRTLDVKAFIESLPASLQGPIMAQAWEKTETDALAAMHQARYELAHMEPELRHQSRRWLEDRGRARFKNLPWPAEAVVEG